MKITKLYLLTIATAALLSCSGDQNANEKSNTNKNEKMNFVFILSDDHRYDFMGFTGKVPWLETPNMDKMKNEGVYFPNTFVTTSLCSPSRASILTGLYSHTHTVIDNHSPDPGNLIFFPEYLQELGYNTAFFGKWHMGGDSDDPRPGFDHWESFRGQGVYYGPRLNINGERKEYSDSIYITDLLTNHTLDWLEERDTEKPFFIYLSHKAVHGGFEPARRHQGRYAEEEVILPPSYNTSESSVTGKSGVECGGQVPLTGEEYYGPGRIPDWQKMQRESWHGVDYMYHGRSCLEDVYRRYCESLLAVDEGIGKIMDYLERNGLMESTIIFYMGDNGFAFGEHGLIDKRHFYEESVKVPFLMYSPGLVPENMVINNMIQNIDVGPTILEIAGMSKPDHMQGYSILPLLKNDKAKWRSRIFYEYYWEYDYPQTPTMHGVRTDDYKLIRYHGIWDTNEFYDLKNDPWETNNLIDKSEHQDLIRELTSEIYDWLEDTGGMSIPLKRTVKNRYGDHRNPDTY